MADADWEDDDYDVEEVLRAHSAAASRSGSSVQNQTDGDGCNDWKSMGSWLRLQQHQYVDFSLPEHLQNLPDLDAAQLASKGYLHAEEEIPSKLFADSTFSSLRRGFDLLRLESEELGGKTRVGATSLAVTEMLTLPLEHSAYALAASRCRELLCSHLTELGSLHPKLGAVIQELEAGEAISGDSCLQAMQMRFIKDATHNEYKLCHADVDPGLLTLVVPLGCSADVMVSERGSYNWVVRSVPGLSGQRLGAGIVFVGKTLERLASVPAVPWCLIPAGGQRSVSVLVYSLRPSIVTDVCGPFGTSFLNPNAGCNLTRPNGAPKVSLNAHLNDDLLLGVLLWLPLRDALAQIPIARAFVSPDLLSGLVASHVPDKGVAQGMLRSLAVIQHCTSLDLSNLHFVPQVYSQLRTATVIGERLRVLTVPWPGIADALQTRQSGLRVKASAAKSALGVSAKSEIAQPDRLKRYNQYCNPHARGKPVYQCPKIAVVLHRFEGFSSASLCAIPEWRRARGAAKLLEGPLRQFALFLKEGLVRPRKLDLGHVDPTLPLRDVAAAVAGQIICGQDCSGLWFQLYFDGQRLEEHRSLEDYGLSLPEAAELDAILMERDTTH